MKAISENHLNRNIMLNTFHLQDVYIYIYHFEVGLIVSKCNTTTLQHIIV